MTIQKGVLLIIKNYEWHGDITLGSHSAYCSACVYSQSFPSFREPLLAAHSFAVISNFISPLP